MNNPALSEVELEQLLASLTALRESNAGFANKAVRYFLLTSQELYIDNIWNSNSADSLEADLAQCLKKRNQGRALFPIKNRTDHLRHELIPEAEIAFLRDLLGCSPEPSQDTLNALHALQDEIGTRLQNIYKKKISLIERNNRLFQETALLYPELNTPDSTTIQNPTLKSFYEHEVIKRQGYQADIQSFNEYVTLLAPLTEGACSDPGPYEEALGELSHIEKATEMLEQKLTEGERVLLEIQSHRATRPRFES